MAQSITAFSQISKFCYIGYSHNYSTTQQNMESKINLCELSIDEIIRKIKAFKSDPNLIGLTLVVRRKQAIKGSKHRQAEPHNIENLIQERKACKQTLIEFDEERPPIKENRKVLNDLETYSNVYRKQPLFTTQSAKEEKSFESDCIDFFHDNRMAKAKSNYAQGNYDVAISIFSQLLEEAKVAPCKNADYVEGDNQRKVANITFHLANCYYRKKNFDKAIEYYSLEIAEENYKYKAMRKSNLGALYLHLNKNQESLRNYTQALKIYSQCECEDMDLSNTYHNVGNIYMREKMFEIASKYFQMSIEERKCKSPDAELPLFYSAFKLGVSQKCEQKYDESIKTLLYALSFAERGVGDPIQVFREIALVYELAGKFNEALTYYEKICDSGKSTEDEKGYAYERASIIYLKSEHFGESERIMRIAEQCYARAGNERKVSEIRQKTKKNSIQS